MRKRLSALIGVAAATATATVLLASPAGAAGSAFTALSGSAAARYTVPADMKVVRSLALGRGGYERYQQVYGAAGAYVLGGQISVYRSASGAVRTVVGSRYAAIQPQNAVKLSKAAALEKAGKDVGARNTGSTSKPPATDADNHWTLVTPDRSSPGQPALVDAHYYGNVTDDYYLARQGFDFTDCYPGGMDLVAHYAKGYDNAFWNGKVTVYGDGSGIIFRELSGGLDVVAHENTHAVTQCTSDLVYRNESGALNESFSDMLGNAAEFFAAEPLSSNCVRAAGQSACADWTIGEDVFLPADAVPGFRNMGDPEEDNDRTTTASGSSERRTVASCTRTALSRTTRSTYS